MTTSTPFKAISRLTDYEAARILANRDDAIAYKHEPFLIPELSYPVSPLKTQTSLYAFFYQFLP